MIWLYTLGEGEAIQQLLVLLDHLLNLLTDLWWECWADN
jgi:hypothetical protein